MAGAVSPGSNKRRLTRQKESTMIQQHTNPRLNPAEDTIRIGTPVVRFLVTGADANGSVAVLEMTVPAGETLAAPPHSHDAYDETIYGTARTLTWTVDGDTIEIGPGQALCIPRGAVHRFANHSSWAAKALVVISPAAIGPAFFRESAAVINAAAGGPPDRAQLLAIMRRHSLTPAPPPPRPPTPTPT
jgi:quercetin dioxygenase-like cupin family protein